MPIDGSYYLTPDIEKPSKLTISFASDPTAKLGVALTNLDKGEDSALFSPSYAHVNKLLDGDTIAKKSDVRPGDCLVAINGVGFRRFPPDHDFETLIDLNPGFESTNLLDLREEVQAVEDQIDANDEKSKKEQTDEKEKEDEEEKEQTDEQEKEEDETNEETVEEEKKQEISDKEDDGKVEETGDKKEVAKVDEKLMSRVLSSRPVGDSYFGLLKGIKEVKAKKDPNNPLNLTFERYGWLSRVNAWPRFLAARDGNVREAMEMIQTHEEWRKVSFPIDLRQPGIQNIARAKAITSINAGQRGEPPTVYVDISKLIALDSDCTHDNVVETFTLVNEILLSEAADPRHPKTTQFIDLTNTKMANGLRSGLLKTIYSVFEPNYPETLEKMVMYPVSPVMAKTARILLSFVNEKTKSKFTLTDDLTVVCQELGWDKIEVVGCGGVGPFMEKYQKNYIMK